jgi:iron complex transport system ATP-binding protein
MPQDNAARAALTAFEVVLLGRLRSLALRVGPADLEAAAAVMAEIGITELAPRPIGELSGGQRQMVFLAQVLAAGPRVLLLDEPTSALDIAHQLHVLALLREATQRRGLTTIAVLHDLNAAARCADRIALMRDGRLSGIGPPRDILRPDRLAASFGIAVAVDAGSDGYPVVLPLRALPGEAAGQRDQGIAGSKPS